MKIRYDTRPITEGYLQLLKDEVFLVSFCKVLAVKRFAFNVELK